MNKIEVGILGATGMVGPAFYQISRRAIRGLTLTWLGASDRSAGKNYRDACQVASRRRWRRTRFADRVVEECKPGNAPRLLFSAMDASVATEIEQAFAQAGHVVVSNSKNHRMDRDVPLLVPEINPDHLKLVPGQQRVRGWKGQIVTNPNCSTVVLTMALGPLKQFGIDARHRDHHAGHLRRRLSGRAFHGHQRQRDPLHRRRRREDAAGDPEDSGRTSRATISSRCRPKSARIAIACRWSMATP